VRYLVTGEFGEDDIGWWHEVNVGFAGRRPLIELQRELRRIPSRYNGTFVWPPGSNELVRVEADVPVRLEPGTVVYLGTRSFTLEGTDS
jgi:hypothetical protein